jgi:hypothetical protein
MGCFLLRVFVSSWLITVVVSAQAVGELPTAWLGTWKLNVAKSTSAGPFPYRRGTRSITASDDGRVTIVDDLVRIRGGILHLEWTGKFDGVDYPVQGVEVVLTSAYRGLDDRTWELRQKIDGDPVATVRFTISPDGRTLTSVTSTRTDSATTVYDKVG